MKASLFHRLHVQVRKTALLQRPTLSGWEEHIHDVPALFFSESALLTETQPPQNCYKPMNETLVRVYVFNSSSIDGRAAFQNKTSDHRHIEVRIEVDFLAVASVGHGTTSTIKLAGICCWAHMYASTDYLVPRLPSIGWGIIQQAKLGASLSSCSLPLSPLQPFPPAR